MLHPIHFYQLHMHVHMHLHPCTAMPFAFCTRERMPWCEFAECAYTGRTTKLCQSVCRTRAVQFVNPKGNELGDSSCVVDDSDTLLQCCTSGFNAVVTPKEAIHVLS